MGGYHYVVSRNWVEVGGLDLTGCVQGPNAGFCEHGYETLGFIKCKQLFDLFFKVCHPPFVCVTNEREESVVNQHNLFRKMYSNNETTCFGL